jgi:hypothetical protein
MGNALTLRDSRTAAAVARNIDPFATAGADTPELAEFCDMLDGHLSRMRGDGWLEYLENEYPEVVNHERGMNAVLNGVFGDGAVEVAWCEHAVDSYALIGTLHFTITIGDTVKDIELQISERAIWLKEHGEHVYSYPRVADNNADHTKRRVFLALLSVRVMEHVAETRVSV